MDIALPIAIVLPTFLALNIGANNSAASMTTAYGAGAGTKREAIILIAVFALIGSLVAGWAAIILVASVFGIPVSLAEIITSGIIGFSWGSKGFSATARNNHVLRIAFLVLVPFFTLAASYALSSLYFEYCIAAM